MQTLWLAWGEEALADRYGGSKSLMVRDYIRGMPIGESPMPNLMSASPTHGIQWRAGAPDVFAAGVSTVMLLCEVRPHPPPLFPPCITATYDRLH